MKRGFAVLLGLSLAWCSPAAMALSVFDVIELTRNGYDETEIERLIEVTNARFVVDVDSLLALGEADVADEIITLMLERGGVPQEDPSEADQLVMLREAGFSEETILQFVRHRNVCDPLADEEEHRLGQAGFSNTFMREFRDQVEDCRKERESIALVEPVQEVVYDEAPAPATRVYRTDRTVYPSSYPVRYPRTTYYAPRYYPPRYYGIYDSYYYHDRITRVYPVIVYRDYSGHRHRQHKAGHRHGKHGKASHRGRDHDRRRHDGDGRRADRRGDRQKGDRDRRRRRDSEGGPRRSHPPTDATRQVLVGTTPPNSVIPPVGSPDKVRRAVRERMQDPVSTRPFVPSPRRTERSSRPRFQGAPSDMRRRIERPEREPNAPAWTAPRPRASTPVAPPRPEPRYRPVPRTQPVTPPPRTPRATAPQTRPATPLPRRQPAVSPPPVTRELRTPRKERRVEQVETHKK